MSEEKAIKNFVKFLVDNGLIFEINRKVLHPVGLALIVDIERGKRNQLAITALLETDDPESFLYDDEGIEVGTEKYKAFLKKRGQKFIDSRIESFGKSVQSED